MEMMVALAVATVVGLVLTTFVIRYTKSISFTTNKALITRDFREFSIRLSADALEATHVVIYPSFDQMTRDNRRRMGESGDCLVLVRTVPFRGVNGDRIYQKIVVYYREAGASPTRPIYRRAFIHLGPIFSTKDQTIEEHLATIVDRLGPPKQVLASSEGFAGGDDFFYRKTVNSFRVNAEIHHGKHAREVSNVYSLTFSTGG